MKNSNDTIGNRTRDLPACSAVPQPTAPPRAPLEGPVFYLFPFACVGTRWRSWLRQSYMPEVRGFDSRWVSLKFFIDLLLPVAGRTMALGSTQPLRISWDKDGRRIELTTLSPSRADCLNNSGSINLLELSGPVYGLLYLLH